MKRFLGIMTMACLLAASCATDEGDSWGGILYTELAEVTYVGDNGYFEMVWDNGPLLKVVRNDVAGAEVVRGQRIYCSFSILGYSNTLGSKTVDKNDVFDVNLIYMHSLVSKPILVQSALNLNEDLDEQVGYDGIYSANQWIVRNWLNLEFEYIRYYTEVPHIISLVWDDTRSGTVTATGDNNPASDIRDVYLVLRHNAMGEDPVTSVPTKTDSGMASFDLSGIIGSGEGPVRIFVTGEQYVVKTGELLPFVRKVGIYDPAKANEPGYVVRPPESEYYLGPPVNTTAFVR